MEIDKLLPTAMSKLYAELREHACPLIGLCGYKGSGKSYVANVLTSYPVISRAVILPFAKPIKDMAKLIGWDGQKDDKGRRLLQLLGTECGRECIHPNIWVYHWCVKAADLVENGARLLIVDDVRFRNELECIQKVGGWVIGVMGPKPDGEGDTHASEAMIGSLECDGYVDNSRRDCDAELAAAIMKEIYRLRGEKNDA